MSASLVFYAKLRTGDNLPSVPGPPKGNLTQWTYDKLDRVEAEKNQLNKERSYSYDLVGNLKTYVDRRGRKTTYDYDLLDRMTTEKWYNESGTLTRTISYGYDLLSRLETATDRSSAGNPASADYGYIYDDGDRVTQVVSTVAGLSAIGSVTFDQKHDLAGRRVRQTAQYDGSEVLDYQNDVTVL